MLKFGMPTLIEVPDWEESAALCRRLGLDFIELNMSFPRNRPERLEVEKLREIKERYGVFYTVHIDESLDVCSVNPRIAEVYRDDMRVVAKLARELEIPTLNMHLLRGIYVTLPEKRVYIYGENEALFLDALRRFRDEMTALLEGSGVTICVENTDGYDQDFLLHGIDLLLESPVFGLTFDIGHDHALGRIDEPEILARGERLRHMHMHDGLGKNVHLALGDGEMDIEYFLKLALEHDCRVVLETKTVAALEQSADYIHNWRNRLCSPEERWDLLDAEGRPLGRTHRRGDPLPAGTRHRAVHVWLQRPDGRFLLTKRAAHKGYGGKWECSGGSALAGEDSLTAALRELREETGLSPAPEQGRPVLSRLSERSLCDVWLFRADFAPESLALQPGETVSARAVTAEQLRALSASGELMPYSYLEQLLAAAEA